MSKSESKGVIGPLAPRRTVSFSPQVSPRKSAPATGRTPPGKRDVERANLLLDATQASRSYETLLALCGLSKANHSFQLVPPVFLALRSGKQLGLPFWPLRYAWSRAMVASRQISRGTTPGS